MPRNILIRTMEALALRCGRQLIPGSRDAVQDELIWARNMLRLGGRPQDHLLYLTHPVETVHLRWLLDLHHIETVIDVGANRGQCARRFRAAGFAGDLHCFEPQSHLQPELGALVESHARTRLHAHALGETNATLELTRFAEDSFSYFHAASAQGRQSFASELRPIGREAVPVHRLDACWTPMGAPDPARCLLKTDTQGHDIAVLRGAGDLLDSIPVVFTEAPILTLYENAAGFAELCSFLATRGLHLSGTYPVSLDPATGALLELNAWFARHPSRP